MKGELPRNPKPCSPESVHVLHIQDQVRVLKVSYYYVPQFWHWSNQVHQLLHWDPWVPNSSWDCPRASHGCQLSWLLNDSRTIWKGGYWLWVSICTFLKWRLQFGPLHMSVWRMWCFVLVLLTKPFEIVKVGAFQIKTLGRRGLHDAQRNDALRATTCSAAQKAFIEHSFYTIDPSHCLSVKER